MLEGFTGQYLDSVELLLPGASEWTVGPKLPAAMKEGMAVNLNSHVLLTGGYQDFVGPVDEVDICMNGEHGKQDKQRKLDQILGLNRSARLNGDFEIWTS